MTADRNTEAGCLLDRLSLGRRRIQVDGDELVIRPGRGIPSQDLDLARELKAELMGILREATIDAAEERAAILEYDAGFTRNEAEMLASVGLIHDGMMTNSPSSVPVGTRG